MKHIYLIGNGSRAAQYGVGTYICQMIEFFRQASSVRLTVVVLNSEVKEVTEEYDDLRVVRHLRIPAQYSGGREKDIDRCYRNIAYLLALYFLKNEHNLLHLNYLHHAPLVDWLRKIGVNFHLLVTIHYFDWCFMLKGNTRLFRSIIKREKEQYNEWTDKIRNSYERDKALLCHSDKVICLTQYTQTLLNEVYGVEREKLVVVYNGLKDEAIKLSEEERLEKRFALGFRETDKIILFVGRLDRIKGVQYLIEAFRRVIRKNPNSRLVIVGDGDYDKYLKQCAGIWSYVVFTGKVEKEVLYTFYQIADVGVLPSFHEQCSYVAIEMLMHGLPLIGTDSTGLKEMVEGMHCLPLKEEDDSVDLPIDLLVQWLIEDQEHLRSEKYRRRFEERYTLRKMSENMFSIYLNL